MAPQREGVEKRGRPPKPSCIVQGEVYITKQNVVPASFAQHAQEIPPERPSYHVEFAYQLPCPAALALRTASCLEFMSRRTLRAPSDQAHGTQPKPFKSASTTASGESRSPKSSHRIPQPRMATHGSILSATRSQSHMQAIQASTRARLTCRQPTNKPTMRSSITVNADTVAH